MKFSDLKGRSVVNLEGAKKVGEVEDLMINVDEHQVVSVKVKTGRFSASQVIFVSEVKNVGPDAVTVTPSDNSAPASQPDRNAPASLQELIGITDIIGNQVVTDTGALVGEVRDVMVDPATWAVAACEVREGGLFTKPQEFAVTPEVRFGKKIVTVPAQLLGGARNEE